MTEISIVPISDEYVEGFHRCVGVVARERKYLALTDSPPIESTRAFVRSVLDGGGVQLVALDGDDNVVGWCDITRPPIEGFRHSGRLGMGLLPEYHGRGLGRRLAEASIDAARANGVERVELEVFASNTRAIRLYERLGFAHEGVRRRARKIDGAYDDNVMMALVFDA
ncbi:MAG TPA: GNAT family N-acetyltransferase [Gemmatimonadaceae bacterium]|nr:GNAT family N-acetyltransferase [Gemmatimonadaceae bacterium]